MIYLTGDCHGDFKKIKEFCEKTGTTTDDTLIILGDAGINFYNNIVEVLTMIHDLSHFNITIACVHGNHDMRPQKVRDISLDTYDITDKPMYKLRPFKGGKAWQCPYAPNVWFLKDGQKYEIEGKSFLIAGGAYSVDKGFRLAHGWPWFEDEQLPIRAKNKILKTAKELKTVDYVLTHTIPVSYIPKLGIEPLADVDQSTEEWLEELKNVLTYKAWYAGHFHMDKTIDTLHILFNRVEELTC